MASPEFQPPAPRGPEFRPNIQSAPAHEAPGRSVEAAPMPANVAPAPAAPSSPGPTDNSRTATIPAPKRTAFGLGRPDVKLPERSDASQPALVDRAIRVVSENGEDPALQKDKLSRIMEACQALETSDGE